MIKYDHLLGKQFAYGKQDCLTLFRDFYKDNFGIVIPNYARPKEWWKTDLNLYADLARKNGFEPLSCHPSEYRTGDVFLMAIEAHVGNHVGILVEGGKILHHLWGRLSIAEPYAGLTRNTTVSVWRHKDAKIDEVTETANLLDLVSPRVKRKLDEYLRSAETL